MLQEISDALESTGEKVWYGQADELNAEDAWNYIVFYRLNLGVNQSKTSFVDVYEVAIVHEEYIPDEIISAVISAMRSIPGMRLYNTDGVYQYTTKPNTRNVIEILTLDFVRPSKVCPK